MKKKYVTKYSRGKRHLSYAVYGRPNKENNYYLVKVWEDNGGSYYTHFNFYVNKKTFAIMYDDIVHDTLISYTDWSRERKQKH